MNSFTDADLDRFLAEDPGGPVVMLNLLRFKPDGGRERYAEYLRRAQEVTAGQDVAEPIYFGDGGRSLEADRGVDWDALLLVRYPSRQRFAEMIRAPEYQAITHLREAALEDAVLQPTTPVISG